MFVSTVVPSTRLNARKNGDVVPYSFSLPYNFVRGRNLTVSINSNLTALSNPNHQAMPASVEFYGSSSNTSNSAIEPGSTNQINVVIPDNVTEYTVTKEFFRTHVSTNRWDAIYYTIQIKFDITAGIITFTPISTRQTLASLTYVDDFFTAPSLIVVSTNL